MAEPGGVKVTPLARELIDKAKADAGPTQPRPRAASVRRRGTDTQRCAARARAPARAEVRDREISRMAARTAQGGGPVTPAPTIQAIETEYHGCQFRSRLEARWGVFFDRAGIP
jgi:hypothetical protein